MKLLFSLFAFLFWSSLLFAQAEFAPVGSIWYYTWGATSAFGYEKILSEKDTFFNDINWKKLTDSITYSNVYSNQVSIIPRAPVFVYEDSSRYYFYFNQQTHLLYDFNAQPGDTFSVLRDPFWSMQVDKVTVTVDSTGIENINGLDLKWIRVSSPDYSEWPWSARIYEKLGSLCYLFPTYDSPLYEGYYLLRCYDDSEIGDFETGVANSCDELFLGIVEPGNNFLSISPNPAHDYIAIECAADFYSGEIYICDLAGRKLKTSILTNSKIEIPVSDLPPGVYMLRLKNYITRFVKE